MCSCYYLFSVKLLVSTCSYRTDSFQALLSYYDGDFGEVARRWKLLMTANIIDFGSSTKNEKKDELANPSGDIPPPLTNFSAPATVIGIPEKVVEAIIADKGEFLSIPTPTPTPNRTAKKIIPELLVAGTEHLERNIAFRAEKKEAQKEESEDSYKSESDSESDQDQDPDRPVCSLSILNGSKDELCCGDPCAFSLTFPPRFGLRIRVEGPGKASRPDATLRKIRRGYVEISVVSFMV